MPKDFKCALPSRAGRTLLFGAERIAIGHDLMARGVSEEAARFFAAQPGVWEEVKSSTPAQADVAPPAKGADKVQLPSSRDRVVLPKRRPGRPRKVKVP